MYLCMYLFVCEHVKCEETVLWQDVMFGIPNEVNLLLVLKQSPPFIS